MSKKQKKYVLISANFAVYCQQIQLTFKYLIYSVFWQKMSFFTANELALSLNHWCWCFSGCSVLHMQTLTSSAREELVTLLMLCRDFLKSDSFYWISADNEPVQWKQYDDSFGSFKDFPEVHAHHLTRSLFKVRPKYLNMLLLFA